jgi:hypothetical protein
MRKANFVVCTTVELALALSIENTMVLIILRKSTECHRYALPIVRNDGITGANCAMISGTNQLG